MEILYYGSIIFVFIIIWVVILTRLASDKYRPGKWGSNYSDFKTDLTCDHLQVYPEADLPTEVAGRTETPWDPSAEEHLEPITKNCQACSVPINTGRLERQPLPLNADGFHKPDPKGNLSIADGDTVRFACPGSYVEKYGKGVQEVTAVCEKGNLIHNGASCTLQDFECHSYPAHIARISGEKGYEGAVMIEIGFEVGTEFFKIMDICFDEATRNTLWCKCQLGPSIAWYQGGTTSLSFKPDNFYPGMDPDTLYRRDTERETVSRILKSTALAKKYIPENKGHYYMARGHVLAKVDFVYGSQQRATYYFVNVVPQWQTFNAGNWSTIEKNVRDFAVGGNYELEVITGTHGVTTLPDINNVEQEIWLYVGKNGEKAIPVPKLFWKVLYHPSSQLAIVIVGVNNPHIPNPDSSYHIGTKVACPAWLTGDQTNVKSGIYYCCAVDDVFRAAVKSLPAFPVRGLLT